MDLNSITLKKYGESMHLTPSGKEGHYHTAEEVYEMLPKSGKKKTCDGNSGCAVGRAKQIQANGGSGKAIWDDHSRWGMCEEDDTLRDVWVKRFEDAAESISVRDPSNSRGLLPMFAKRRLEELHKAQTDWRTILNDFIQEDVVDYSFYPPDRRFDGSPFFLPDFNGTDEKVEDILFMIDTSGSMSDKMITAAYSEVKGAIDQFDGKLRGWLGFFDAAIIEPIEFSNEEEFRVIRPAGGGGTDFQIIFEYVATRMTKRPASIIILTDGFCPFPQEKLSLGIPVLWLINNEDVDPPWGKVARIKV
jgi:predicted metal-dependent peptidase